MRSLLLLAFFAMILGVTFFVPYVGLLSWAWISFMHPQRETYGMTTYFSFDWYVAVVTILAWIFSGERKSPPMGLTPVLLILFGIWICVTTYFAINPDFSFDLWQRTEKSLILALFVIIMTTTKVRAQAFVWVIAISLGYYAVLGDGWVLGGGGHATGPVGSMIQDNNSLGVALVTTLPLLIYLIRTSAHKWVVVGCYAVAGGTVLAVIGTFSRGAFIGLVVLGTLLLLRSRGRVVAIVMALFAVVMIFELAPQSWHDRMTTIFAETPDQSVQGRFQAWRVAWNVATTRPLGGGFQFGEQQAVWDRYTADPGSRYHAAHNIYFEVLGEHGFVGLAIYIMILASALRNTQIASRLARDRGGAETIGELSNALRISIICLAVAGNSLSIAYYDVYLAFYALTFALRKMVETDPLAGPDLLERRWVRAPRVGDPSQ